MVHSYWTDWISPNNIKCDHILFSILNWSISSRNYSTTWVWHHAGLVYQLQMRPCYYNFVKQWLVSCIVTRVVNRWDLSSYGQRSPGPISLCIADVSHWLPNDQTLPRKLEPTRRDRERDDNTGIHFIRSTAVWIHIRDQFWPKSCRSSAYLNDMNKRFTLQHVNVNSQQNTPELDFDPGAQTSVKSVYL